MRYKSFSKTLAGTVKEILGTAFSVGCQVEGKSPKVIQEQIDSGEIDSESSPNGPAPPLSGRGDLKRTMLTIHHSPRGVKKKIVIMRHGGLGPLGLS